MLVKDAADPFRRREQKHVVTIAVRPVGHRHARFVAGDQSARAPRVVEDGLADLLSQTEFRQELTEAMLETAPTLTGSQIVLLRRKLVQLAQSHNWGAERKLSVRGSTRPTLLSLKR